MNVKKMLLVAALLVPVYAQGCWKNLSTSVKNTLSLRDSRVAEYKNSLNGDPKEDAKSAAFDQSYQNKAWLYAASKISFGLSGVSALIAATAARCPKYQNEKMLGAATVTAVGSLLSGFVFNRLAHKNFNRAKEAADSAQ